VSDAVSFGFDIGIQARLCSSHFGSCLSIREFFVSAVAEWPEQRFLLFAPQTSMSVR
jgi:hypothetical protein